MPQTVLLTGCSAGGIGHSLALAFQKRGLIVFATARNLSSMSELKQLPNMHLLTLDVTSGASIANAVEQVREKTNGQLDYLVNNAGRSYYMPLLDSDIEIGKQIFDTNFWGVLRMTKAFAPLLVKAKGTMVTIGSICAYLHAPYTGIYIDHVTVVVMGSRLTIYNATKAAVHILDETLRLELAPLGIKVLTVVTGSIETKIHANVITSPLPADSYYEALEDRMRNRVAGDGGIVRVGPDRYAENVVSDILAGVTGKTFRGKNATMVRYGSVMLPMSYIDNALTSGTGFDKLNQK